ncbi:hypothetical protein [Microbacterium ulmi]|uniref:Uncharacterized protein n=1 Tax=Microbacterium ulmi TaxID=179095 RepID=A0A7Y2LXQ2_9MICO|nr:hypothetical protein [Microbacterium ulmi]NII68193.1 type III secretory pathway component EscV [Microbacterium ulmi]NNH02329.1 hypothetical protein [Microbacterium ulmi]
MHAAFVAALVRVADVTPSPAPNEPDPTLVTPGPWGFTVIAFLALAVVLLVWDMLRRIRRGRFREEVREQLDAEEAAARQGQDAERATEIDDQDIDPGADPRG